MSASAIAAIKHVIHEANHVKRGSVSERIVGILYSGTKNRHELIRILGINSRIAGREITRLVRKKILAECEEQGRKFYSLTQFGTYIYLCLELDISLLMVKILALAYHNFDVSATNNLSINFPVTKPEVVEKVSVMGHLCSEETAWTRARELASRGYGYVRNGCFILYPHSYQNLKIYEGILQSLYSLLCEIPGRVVLLLLRDNKFRQRVERLSSIMAH